MVDLHDLFMKQYALQRELGYNFSAMSDDDHVQYIKDMVLAATDELHELLGEVGWKPWASSRHVNVLAAQGELVDLFHFFINLCMAVGLSAKDLEKQYLAKRELNLKRQEQGYDGVSTKCPACKRAYDDAAVACTPSDGLADAYCEVYAP